MSPTTRFCPSYGQLEYQGTSGDGVHVIKAPLCFYQQPTLSLSSLSRVATSRKYLGSPSYSSSYKWPSTLNFFFYSALFCGTLNAIRYYTDTVFSNRILTPLQTGAMTNQNVPFLDSVVVPKPHTRATTLLTTTVSHRFTYRLWHSHVCWPVLVKALWLYFIFCVQDSGLVTLHLQHNQLCHVKKLLYLIYPWYAHNSLTAPSSGSPT